MTKNLNFELLDKALKLLSGRLELAGSFPINLVVCGGSALIATGLIMRTTKDVDVVALLDEANELQSSQPLPDQLIEAAKQVADDLGLSKNWLNMGPADLVKFGLPNGFTDRLETRKYGECLTVNFISRLDQIHFKLYAAVDQGPGYHVDDLLALEPAPEELAAAANWALTHDRSDEFKYVLKDMLKKLGYEPVSNKL